MMNRISTSGAEATASRVSVADIARQLAERFAERASISDEQDQFVARNYEELKAAALVEAGVPTELGGRGADLAELCDMIREIAHGCGSTALAFAMHTHQVAVPAWRWRHQKVAAVEPLLKRVAAERLVLLSSGGSDWIGGSGKATRVDGGYRVIGRKAFTSGAAAGNILMTGAILEGGEGPAKVLHFGVPMSAPEVKVADNWRALGMRGTGSNDVVIDGLFVPETNVAFSRTAGEWHPVFQIIATVAFPIIYAAYVGVAEQARDIALGLASKKASTPILLDLAGRMETSLRAAQMAHRHMIATAEENAPSAQSVNEVMIGRTLVADHAIRTVELGLELAGGAGFFRANGLERLFRDIQGARFHPMQAGQQARYTGSMAFGLPVTDIY